VRKHPALGFDYRVEPTSAVTVLVAESGDADLVVVGSNGAGPTRGFLLGSVEQEVLHLAACPVAVVPETVRAPVGRVLVGVDGSPASERALAWAVDEADRRDAELVLVHAWQYPYELTSERFDRGRDLARVDAATLLEQQVAAVRERRAAPVGERLVEGSAAEVLLDASDIADVVVVGSRGRGGFRSMLLGSVAQSVAAHATCPVVIVR
jgi:nucleotide-binding universal stress UspA family protein